MTLRSPAAGLPGATPAAPAHVWPAGLAARRQAQALLRALDAELRSHDSATLTLERWCAAHGLASPALVVADRAPGAGRPPDPATRALLGVADTEPVRHRRVRLRCGAVVLSEAENWYVPRHLTCAMNAALDASDASFGHVVAPLGFRRHILVAEILWNPLPEPRHDTAAPDLATDLSTDPGGTIAIPPVVLHHRAVLRLADRTPFSVVDERYTGGVLAFPPGRDTP